MKKRTGRAKATLSIGGGVDSRRSTTAAFDQEKTQRSSFLLAEATRELLASCSLRSAFDFDPSRPNDRERTKTRTESESFAATENRQSRATAARCLQSYPVRVDDVGDDDELAGVRAVVDQGDAPDLDVAGERHCSWNEKKGARTRESNQEEKTKM